jgi:transglutaminase-like putative cysteine protease
VDLGIIGKVKLDPTVVMRVEFPDHKGPIAEHMLLYFRGAAYDTYDGRAWSNLHPLRRMLDRAPDGGFQVPPDTRPMNAAGTGIRQEILIEALDTTVLFGVSFVDSIKGRFPVPQVDRLGGLSLPYAPSSRFQYTVISTTAQPAEGDRIAAALGYPRSITDAYLQVPERSLRVSALAQEVTGASTTPYEKVQAIERHLKQNYQYSLDVGTAVPTNPIEEFLFTRKTGFCEHYATAMVVMLRSLGIPARLVTGFLPGEWNDFGNYYSVRQQDAHAWVEVFFPRSGWLTFDPTPSVAAPPPPILLVAKVGRFVDSLRLKWDRYVIQYSFRDQMEVVQGIREQSDKARTQAGQWLAPLLRWMGSLRATVADVVRAYGMIVVVGAGACAIGIALIVAFALRRRQGGMGRGGNSRTAGQVAAVQIYGRMLRFLETRGVRKAPGATPLEFARVVSREWCEAARFVGPLTDLYCRVRFGQVPFSPEDQRMAEDVLGGLRAIPR